MIESNHGRQRGSRRIDGFNIKHLKYRGQPVKLCIRIKNQDGLARHSQSQFQTGKYNYFFLRWNRRPAAVNLSLCSLPYKRKERKVVVVCDGHCIQGLRSARCYELSSVGLTIHVRGRPGALPLVVPGCVNLEVRSVEMRPRI